MDDAIGRRDLLRLGAAAGLAAGLGRAARGQEKAKPVRLAFIGVGGRGTGHLRTALANPAIEVTAACDIVEARTNRAIAMVGSKREGRKPEGFSKGPHDYRRLLKRDDIDGVVIATPMQWHAQMAIDAMRAGKHVLCEVAAAVTLDECWGVVRAEKETGKIYMMAENACYWPHVMMIANMVAKGLFGEPTYAECGYVHDCRALSFNSDGTLTWRGELGRDHTGNVYPTHSLGPIAHWLGLNRGDRMVELVSMTTKSKSIERYAAKRFPEGNPARKVRFKLGDSNNTFIRTAKGVVIDIRFDMYSAHPGGNNNYYTLQGLQGCYRSKTGRICIEGRSKGWDTVDKFAAEFQHEKWKRWGEEAKRTGHGGADFFMIHEFVEAIRTGGPSPVPAADACAWSAIIPLSGQSIAQGSRPVEIPDFTEGRWERAGG